MALAMRRFLVVIEKAERTFSAYSPDLAGCVATGRTLEEVGQNMHEAVQLHVRSMIADGLPVPDSTSFAEYIAIT
jgi:predicted RNase H-like HicB family nuclease